jgi:hypothetical protein
MGAEEETLDLQQLNCPPWLKKVLGELDVDKNGLSKSEIEEAFEWVAKKAQERANNTAEIDIKAQPEKVQKVLKIWDDDDSGTVGVSELVSAANAQKKMNEEYQFLIRLLAALVGLIIFLILGCFFMTTVANEYTKDFRPSEGAAADRRLRFLSSEYSSYVSPSLGLQFDVTSGGIADGVLSRFLAPAYGEGPPINADPMATVGRAGELITAGETKARVGMSMATWAIDASDDADGRDFVIRLFAVDNSEFSMVIEVRIPGCPTLNRPIDVQVDGERIGFRTGDGVVEFLAVQDYCSNPCDDGAGNVGSCDVECPAVRHEIHCCHGESCMSNLIVPLDHVGMDGAALTAAMHGPEEPTMPGGGGDIPTATVVFQANPQDMPADPPVDRPNFAEFSGEDDCLDRDEFHSFMQMQPGRRRLSERFGRRLETDEAHDLFLEFDCDESDCVDEFEMGMHGNCFDYIVEDSLIFDELVRGYLDANFTRAAPLVSQSPAAASRRLTARSSLMPNGMSEKDFDHRRELAKSVPFKRRGSVHAMARMLCRQDPSRCVRGFEDKLALACDKDKNRYIKKSEFKTEQCLKFVAADPSLVGDPPKKRRASGDPDGIDDVVLGEKHY